MGARRPTAFIILLLCFATANAQHGKPGSESRYKYDVGFNFHPGFLIAHRDDARNLEAHTYGFELQFTRQYRREASKLTWASHYNAPRVGVNFLYMNLGRPGLTGEVYALIPNFETSFKIYKKSEIRFRLGAGLGFLTHKFDPWENRHNLAIGSHVNGAMQTFVSYNHEFGPLRVKVGVGATHFSNGSFRVPNLGVNMPSFILGANYAFGTYAKDHDTGDTLTDYKFQFVGSYAFKELYLADPHEFHIIGINGARIFRRNMITDWRLGADMFFDKTHQFLKDPDKSRKGLRPWEMTEVGVFGGHQWQINRVHLLTDVGFYLYKPSSNKFFTYQRIGFLIHVTDRVFLYTTLKTHFGVADFFDWGIGYRL